MHVKSIQLDNIRSFEKTKIELHPNINLLVGPNNSGKSTIIKTLYSMQSTNALEFDDVRKGRTEGKAIVSLTGIDTADTYLFAANDSKNVVPESQDVALTLAMSKQNNDPQPKKSMFYTEQTSDGTSLSGGKLHDFFLFPDDESKRNFIYPFFAKRKVYGYSRQIGGRDNAFKISPDLSNLVTKIQHISNRSHRQSERFHEIANDILGFDMGIVPYHNNDNTPGIFVDDSITIEAERMGEGVVNILGMLALLLTQDNRLYLIEEPENDIHPKALKKLLNLIIEKSENNQFVISTHSNIVVKYLGDPDKSKIFGLKWQPQNRLGQNIPTSEIAAIEPTPEAKLALLTDLGYDLLDFDLYSSYIIFEESSAERIIRDFLIPWFAPGLKNKVRTIAAQGVADLQTRVIDFARLFVFIHQTPVYRNKCWVFADGDAAGKKCIEELRDNFKDTWKSEQFQSFSEANFEAYYPVPFTKQYAIIQSIKDKNEKRLAKRKLLQAVIDWAEKNNEAAKKKFKKSFAEIIVWLNKIESEIHTDD